MKNSKRQKILYWACERLELLVNAYSCNAIDLADGGNFGRSLAKKYAKFYDKNPYAIWEFSRPFTKIGAEERIMAVLFFEHIKTIK